MRSCAIAKLRRLELHSGKTDSRRRLHLVKMALFPSRIAGSVDFQVMQDRMQWPKFGRIEAPSCRATWIVIDGRE